MGLYGIFGKERPQERVVSCFETRQLIAAAETERCEETGKLVRPEILVHCAVTGKRVLPSLCGRCSVSHKLALKRVLVSGSISQAPAIADFAVQSLSGKFCLPSECQACSWTAQKYHPDDIGMCTLTGLSVHVEYLTRQESRSRPLFELLNDVDQSAKDQKFPILEDVLLRKADISKCRIVSGVMSPTKSALAVCAKVRAMLGLRTSYLGFVFSPQEREIIGRVAQGRRTKQGWFEITN